MTTPTNSRAARPPRRSLFAVWRWPWWAMALAMLLMVPSAYFSVYLALLRGAGRVPIYSFENGDVATAAYPMYRFGNIPPWWGQRLQYALAPAHQLDRKLRTRYWANDPVPPTAPPK